MLAHMDGYTRSVLVVEHDPTERERLASTLEGDGFQVLLCSGPTEPDYTCIGSRSGTCPLAAEEAVVVLDMSLDSETVMMGTPAEELLEMYLGSGHPVLALGSRPGEEMSGRLLRRRRHPEAAVLIGGCLAAGLSEALGTRSHVRTGPPALNTRMPGVPSHDGALRRRDRRRDR